MRPDYDRTEPTFFQTISTAILRGVWLQNVRRELTAGMQVHLLEHPAHRVLGEKWTGAGQRYFDVSSSHGLFLKGLHCISYGDDPIEPAEFGIHALVA